MPESRLNLDCGRADAGCECPLTRECRGGSRRSKDCLSTDIAPKPHIPFYVCWQALNRAALNPKQLAYVFVKQAVTFCGQYVPLAASERSGQQKNILKNIELKANSPFIAIFYNGPLSLAA